MRTIEVEIRGAPLRLLRAMAQAEPPMRIREVLIDGPAGTGKTRAVGHLLHWAMLRWPGIRVLVVRATRASLTDSFLQIWEEEVIPFGDPMLAGPQRQDRTRYRCGASEMVVGSLDKDTRLFSTQYDIVFVEEAIEVTLENWAKFRRALRHFGHPEMHFQLLLGATNPGDSEHWLNKRCNDGATLRLQSRHEDNPSYFDGKEWTPKGTAYLASLDELPPIIYEQLRLGLWTTAAGAVWPNWKPAIHLLTGRIENEGGRITLHLDSRPEPIDIRWTLASMDWGHTHPGCFQVWGVDGDGRLYRLVEVYRTAKSIDWWAEWAETLHREFGLTMILADPSRKDAIEAFNKRLGPLGGRGTEALCRGADNTKHPTAGGSLAGLDAVRWALEPAGDGLPRMVLLKNALRGGRDPVQNAKRLPCCTEEEIPGYVFAVDATTGKPLERTDPRCRDDGCDCTRYIATFAFGKDYTPPKPRKRDKPGTIGEALGFQEFWDSLPGPDPPWMRG